MMEMWKMKNLVLLKNAVGNVELTESEKQTLEWLAGLESVTIDNLVSIIRKVGGKYEQDN